MCCNILLVAEAFFGLPVEGKLWIFCILLFFLWSRNRSVIVQNNSYRSTISLIYYGYVLITAIFLERVLSAALIPLNDYVFSAMK
jgi:hypothetical protein